jgi:hypothetical protein
MSASRSFAMTYGPIFVLAAVITCLYTMAIAIGLSLGTRPEAGRGGSFRIFYIPNIAETTRTKIAADPTPLPTTSPAAEDPSLQPALPAQHSVTLISSTP